MTGSSDDPRGEGRTRPREVEHDLHTGLALMEEGALGKAVKHLERAFRLATSDTEVMSSYGLALALAGVDRLRGVALCEAALRQSGFEPSGELFHNLGRAYLVVHYRVQAAEVLRRGAAIAPQHRGIHEALLEMGIRRRPVFSFLPRGNPVNKYLGLIRERLFPRSREEI